MTLRVLILRPSEGARKTEKLAHELGLQPVVDPMFEIRPLAWDAPSANNHDAMLFTSANAVAYAGDGLTSYKHLPILAVGSATSTALKAKGFTVVFEGKGGVQALLDQLPSGEYRNILHLTGKHTTARETDRMVDSIAVYESVRIGLGDAAKHCLATGSMVLLHSSRAAQILVDEMKKEDLNTESNHIIAISPKVAKAAGSGWKSLDIADQPSDEALLAKAASLCSVEMETRSPNEPGL